ncbi:bifunctional tetrahydrofolate synthase/dihydrofolate synthase [Methylotenera versatilis]|uniref:bifunctional tetrahydrofolate synthase/dihydrofolate synthase n=1 Tax=Methylotenera versatilis TaxID=1055487 RepID=UPI0006468B46|nr:bifunctional tetrahydrofolate synthase/dihydrofolate synthase [Methylotenera versatilis]
MTNIKPKPTTAQQWLAYIEAQHPKAIAMGLDRVNAVAQKLQLEPAFPIITVAGTNGKGSTCALLSQVYLQAGYRVGCYTSPHLMRYNERVRVNDIDISDDDLCVAFDAIEQARGDIALTYFEIGTLAAMWHFCQNSLDIVILEVGLGGRLDAVNIFSPTCSIVTTIDLDHMDYLGDTREKIGFEKAGIFRENALAICGDENPPQSLIDHAAKIGTPLKLINRDFTVTKTTQAWQYSAEGHELLLPNLGMQGDFQLSNAACVVCATQYLNTILPVSLANIHEAFQTVTLIGRFYQIHTQPIIVVDVAHNPHAAVSLAHNLKAMPCAGKTFAVFAMLADKDIDGVIHAVAPNINQWFVADNHSPRGAKAFDLNQRLIKNDPKSVTELFADVTSALNAACKTATKNDRIIVFGSFYTVADAMSTVLQNTTSTP